MPSDAPKSSREPSRSPSSGQNRGSGAKASGVRSDGTPRRPNPKARKRIPPPPAREPKQWIRDDEPASGERQRRSSEDRNRERARRGDAPFATELSPSGAGGAGGLEPEIDRREFEALANSKTRARTLANRVGEAASHFAAERYIDARRLLRPIAEELPGSPTVRELYGLTQYCLGNWNEAVRQLEALRAMPGYNCEQHPVLMDSYRALKRWHEVDELWEELREVSPSKELIVEGRIVAAGALADRGKLKAAVDLLEDGWKAPRRPKPAHLSQAYALADLYERSGDVIRARTLMGWVATMDPGFSDAAQRAESM